MTTRTGAGTPPRRRAPGARRLAALALAGALVLAGCSGEDDTPTEQAPTGDGAVSTGGGGDGGQETAGGPAPAPTEPADLPAAAGDRSASGTTSIVVDADQAGFVLPTGNIACSVTDAGAVCQISDKSFTPLADHLSTANIAGCDAAEADVIRLAEGRGAWTCATEPVLGAAQVATGGFWAEQVGGETLDEDGQTLAVLPYGSSLTVGATTCNSSEAGVSCANSSYGRDFTLSRTSYNYG